MIETVVLNVLKVLQPNKAFAFNANQARPVITSLNDYLNKILGAPIKTGSLFITVTRSGEPLVRRYNSIDSKDLNYLFLKKVYTPL